MSNFKNVWYSSELFFGAIFIGTFIAISRSNWMVAWMGIELNIISFLGWICTTGKSSLKVVSSWGPHEGISYYSSNIDPFAKYFLAQSVGTALFLFCPLVWGSPYLVSFRSFFLVFGIILKSGVAPFHQWFPSVCSNVSWTVNIILMFWQKIAPLYIIVGATFVFEHFFILIAIINLFFGRIGALGQTQLRSLFAYSSISHMGWIMAMIFFSKVGFFYYFLLYGLMVVPTINIFQVIKVYSFKDIQLMPNLFFSRFLLMVFMVLGVAGMPPFTGFFIKAYRVYLILCSGYFGLSLVFCLFAAIRLSYYIHVIFISVLLRVLNRHDSSNNSLYMLSGYNWVNRRRSLLNIGLVIVWAVVRLPFIGMLTI